MAFNPKNSKGKIAKLPLMTSGGKHAVVLSQLDIIERRVQFELTNKPPKALLVPPPVGPQPRLVDYYIEWWILGTPATDIISGEFSCRYIKAFVKKLVAGNKNSLVYLQRKSDNKVIWNRRTR